MSVAMGDFASTLYGTFTKEKSGGRSGREREASREEGLRVIGTGRDSGGSHDGKVPIGNIVFIKRKEPSKRRGGAREARFSDQFFTAGAGVVGNSRRN